MPAYLLFMNVRSVLHVTFMHLHVCTQTLSQPVDFHHAASFVHCQLRPIIDFTSLYRILMYKAETQLDCVISLRAKEHGGMVTTIFSPNSNLDEALLLAQSFDTLHILDKTNSLSRILKHVPNIDALLLRGDVNKVELQRLKASLKNDFGSRLVRMGVRLETDQLPLKCSKMLELSTGRYMIQIG